MLDGELDRPTRSELPAAKRVEYPKTACPLLEHGRSDTDNDGADQL